MVIFLMILSIIYNARMTSEAQLLADAITRVIPHAQPLFTEGLGHRSILKNREVISQVIGFIES